MTFAEKLIKWRKVQTLSQGAAVELLSGKVNFKISLRTYQAWETGRNQPHGIALAALEAVMRDTEP